MVFLHIVQPEIFGVSKFRFIFFHFLLFQRKLDVLYPAETRDILIRVVQENPEYQGPSNNEPQQSKGPRSSQSQPSRFVCTFRKQMPTQRERLRCQKDKDRCVSTLTSSYARRGCPDCSYIIPAGYPGHARRTGTELTNKHPIVSQPIFGTMVGSGWETDVSFKFVVSGASERCFQTHLNIIQGFNEPLD